MKPLPLENNSSYFSFGKNILWFCFFWGSTLASVWAVTPMEYYDSLVAGGDESGFRDGAFSTARFNNPVGMAFDESGQRLYVADYRNNRVRVIHLDQNNRVETLAGGAAAGDLDGSLSTAAFNAPIKLTAVPGNQLAVFDSGNSSIRLIDLEKKTVTTLAKGLRVRDFVYRPKDDSLYLAEPENGSVQKLDMKTLAVSNVILNNPKIPSPSSLCFDHGHLYVADGTLPAIYEMNMDERSTPLPGPGALSTLGFAKDILAITATDGSLYSLQSGGDLAKVGPYGSLIVKFPTPWGFLFKNQDHQGLTLFNLPAGMPVGFIASPTEARKFYIATEHSIVSVKDYGYEPVWPGVNTGELTDFAYPEKKPPRTFRILMVGSSRNGAVVPFPEDPKAPISEEVLTQMIKGFPKQMEFLLNTEAALDNLNIHFEILRLSRSGRALASYANEEVPALVKKYDIDLVLGLVDMTGNQDYFTRPMTSEGIPGPALDPEYMLKPLSERIPTGPAGDLVQRCKELKIPVQEKQVWPDLPDGWSLYATKDPQLQKDLVDMTGHRLKVFSDKLGAMKTSGGAAIPLVLYFFPGGVPAQCQPFWTAVCSQYHFNFFDLSDSYGALKLSYFANSFAPHPTAFGNQLIARLLDQVLIENKLIPFQPSTAASKDKTAPE